jgi:hypothetical protein
VSRPSPEFDLDSALHHMRANFIQCRDFGHSWRPFTATWDPDYNVYKTALRCSRCFTKRFRDISRDGQQLGNRYDYTDGYTLKGVGRMTGEDRDHLRLESLTRILTHPSHDHQDAKTSALPRQSGASKKGHAA